MSLLDLDVAIVRRNIVLSLRDYVDIYDERNHPFIMERRRWVVQMSARIIDAYDEIHPDRFAKNLLPNQSASRHCG